MLLYKSFIPIFVIFLSFLFLFSIQNVHSIPIIPNETGFGMETPAGRGGEIYKITNLNPEGKGSLKECIDATGKRICIFEVSGYINLEDDLKISNPYISIVGQTAPDDGITISGAGISIQTHDVLIQHIRIRVGDNPKGPDPESRDAISLGSNSNDVYNVIIDHISASWSTDEIISIWSHYNQVYNVTISNSIFSEALHDSLHPKGKHSMGVLVGKNSQNILLKNNIFAHNNARNPLVRDDVTNIIIANNLIYNSGGSSKDKIYFGTRGDKNIPLFANVIGNVYLPKTQNELPNLIYIEEEAPSKILIYLNDNIYSSSPIQNNWQNVLGRNQSSIQAINPVLEINNLNLDFASNIEIQLLNYSGARPTNRDTVDKRVINNIITKKGNIIDSQEEVGAWPHLTQQTRKLNLPKKPHDDDNKNGYTNIEEWIHTYSLKAEIKPLLSLEIEKEEIRDEQDEQEILQNDDSILEPVEIDVIENKTKLINLDDKKQDILKVLMLFTFSIIILIIITYLIASKINLNK